MGVRGYERGEQIPGTQYRFVRLLGQGGYGTVYLVEHVFLEARCVLKTLHANLVDREDISQRMRTEAKTLARMRHKNIVRVHDGGMTSEDPPRPYFVMEYLHGHTLAQALADLPAGLGLKSALGTVVDLLDALDFAHNNDVIHRDLKPGNILLHREPAETIPKILDFGIAHLVGSERRLTGKLFLGTPRYAAPEQILGHRPTPQTDIYAMGLVLYECLCGRGPFHDVAPPADLYRAQLERTPPPLSRFTDDVPARLESIVMSMLSKDPAARPKSAASLAITLREVLLETEAEHKGRPVGLNDTVPTPMENRLIGFSATSDSDPFQAVDTTERDAQPAAALNDTAPLGVAAVRNREGASPSGQGVDRQAATPTMLPDAARAPRSDTALPLQVVPQPIVAVHGSRIAEPEDNVYMPLEMFLPEAAQAGPTAPAGPTPVARREPPPAGNTSGALAMSRAVPTLRPGERRQLLLWIVVGALAVVTMLALSALVLVVFGPSTSGPSAATRAPAASALANVSGAGQPATAAPGSGVPSNGVPSARRAVPGASERPQPQGP